MNLELKKLTQFVKETLPELSEYERLSELKICFEALCGKSWNTSYILNEKCSPDCIEKVKNIFIQRKTGIPLAYLLKCKFFFKSNFYVDERVLIPRADTEVIVEKTIEKLNFIKPSSIDLADFGCGSGCIGLSLIKERPDIRVDFYDISQEALDVSRLNAKRLNINQGLSFYQLDISKESSQKRQKKYDFIIANPPYISQDNEDGSEEYAYVHPDVKRFEPNIALFSTGKGLDDWFLWLKIAFAWLKDKGVIVFEFGDGQRPIIEQVLNDWPSSFTFSFEFFKDNAQLDRGIIIEVE